MTDFNKCYPSEEDSYNSRKSALPDDTTLQETIIQTAQNTKYRGSAARK